MFKVFTLRLIRKHFNANNTRLIHPRQKNIYIHIYIYISVKCEQFYIRTQFKTKKPSDFVEYHIKRLKFYGRLICPSSSM